MLGGAQKRPRVLFGSLCSEKADGNMTENLLQMAMDGTGEDQMEVHTRGRWSNELVYEMLAILDVSTAVVS